jgi:glycosyl transferase family 87
MRQAAAASRVNLADHLINIAPATPAIVLALIAVPLHYTADFGLAYRGGAEAWADGHPQNVSTWTGTPSLALVMAVVSRAADEFVAARVFMALDLALWMVVLAVVWPRIHGHVPKGWWWGSLVAAGLFAPAVSTIFWLQFNLVVFALALGGFILIGRHDRWAGALIGAGLALKPIVILLPLALLLRRRSRPAGAWTCANAAILTELGFVFLAWRAGDSRVLNPFAYLTGFLRNSSQWWACTYENYSPDATLCRLGVATSTAVTIAIAGVVLIAGWLLVRRLPETAQGDWEVFAAACFLSILVGPIAWAHYGLFMAPLFLLLAYQFWRYQAPGALWIGLGLSFALAELGWDPLASLAGASMSQEVVVYTVGQFSQYFLLLTWIRWRMLRSTPAHVVARNRRRG